MVGRLEELGRFDTYDSSAEMGLVPGRHAELLLSISAYFFDEFCLVLRASSSSRSPLTHKSGRLGSDFSEDEKAEIRQDD